VEGCRPCYAREVEVVLPLCIARARPAPGPTSAGFLFQFSFDLSSVSYRCFNSGCARSYPSRCHCVGCESASSAASSKVFPTHMSAISAWSDGVPNPTRQLVVNFMMVRWPSNSAPRATSLSNKGLLSVQAASLMPAFDHFVKIVAGHVGRVGHHLPHRIAHAVSHGPQKLLGGHVRQLHCAHASSSSSLALS